MKPATIHIALLLLASFFFFFFRSGSVPLTEPDEGRNAEVAREMLVTGDWTTPRLNFERKLNKPPLLFWAAALSMKIGGVNEAAARFPSAAAATAGVVAVYFLGRLLFGARAGLLAGLVLASSPLYYAFGRIVIFDMPLASCIVLSMLFFRLGLDCPDPRRKRAFLLLWYAAMALAVLAKGPVGVLIPVPVIGLFLLLTGQAGRVRELEPVRGPLLFLLVAAPWFVLAGLRNPGFLPYFFVTEHIARYTTGLFGRVKPFWYYLPVMAAGMFPWICFLPQALAPVFRRRRLPPARHAPLLFLALWTGFVFLFFTFSRSKQAGYVLPLLPAAALATGAFLDNLLRRTRARVFTASFVAAVLLFGAGLTAADGIARRRTSRDFADRVLAERRPGDAVVTFETFPTTFLFYLGGRVPVVTDNDRFIGGNFPDGTGGGTAAMGRAEFRDVLADRRRRVYILAHRDRAAAAVAEAAAVSGAPRLLLERNTLSLWVREESPDGE